MTYYVWVYKVTRVLLGVKLQHAKNEGKSKQNQIENKNKYVLDYKCKREE